MTIKQVFDEAKLIIIKDAMKNHDMHGVLTNLLYHVHNLEDESKRLDFVRQLMGDSVIIDMLASKLPNYDIHAAIRKHGVKHVCNTMLNLLVIQYAKEVLGVD